MEYSYDEIAKAKALADEKIDKILDPILEHFDKETKRIINMFDEVSYKFSNEEEKAKLLEKFEKVEKEKNNSEYSDYIELAYEIDGKFFMIDCHIARGRFATEQRKKIAQTIAIDFTTAGCLKFATVYLKG